MLRRSSGDFSVFRVIRLKMRSSRVADKPKYAAVLKKLENDAGKMPALPQPSWDAVPKSLDVA